MNNSFYKVEYNIKLNVRDISSQLEIDKSLSQFEISTDSYNIMNNEYLENKSIGIEVTEPLTDY